MHGNLRKITVTVCVLLFLSGLLMIAGTSTALAPPVPFFWETTGGGSGFIRVEEFAYDAEYDVLYAGTFGAGVWRCDGPRAASPTWVDMGIDAPASVVYSITYDSVHGVLYAGTDDGLRRCTNPHSGSPSWTQPASGLLNQDVHAVTYDSVHDQLYASWFDGGSSRHMGVWRCDNPREASLNWTDIGAGTDVQGYRVDCFAYDVSRNILYAACTLEDVLIPSEDGKGVWRCTDPNTSPSWLNTGAGTIDTYVVSSLALDNAGDHLYGSTWGFGTWRCDTPSATPAWSDMGGGFGGFYLTSLAYDPNNNALYVGGWDAAGVRQCLTPDTAPNWDPTGGAIATYDVTALVLDPYSFVLYADCYDFLAASKKDVYRAWVDPASHWYFAEGYTGTGFQEYLCLGNPNAASMNARVTYLFPDGTAQSANYNIPATSRFTVDVNATVGPGRDVSMLVTSTDYNLIAERPMYFSYGPGWTGGHDAVGATFTSTAWYFAEGYTGPGFDEWICVLNPGGSTANLTFRFQTQTSGEIVPAVQTVPPYSRASFSANTLLGGATYETSLLLESDLPVVAERPMYFDYLGGDPAAPKHWTGGHCVMGEVGLANDYYFAEGYTGAGFDEYITIQNPLGAPITVNAEYQLGQGQGGPVSRSYTVPAESRSTVYVNGPEGVGEGVDTSVHLSSSEVFLAERPMYFNYTGYGAPGWTGGHCVIGSRYLNADWFFAEGYTGPGFDEFLCIQNPNPADAAVTITYYPQGGTPIVKAPITVAANSRRTIYVNDVTQGAGPGLSISTKVTADQNVIAERPMYFDFFGWTGGHDVVGYAP